ncbi:hypothetical protein FHG87_025289 [Trinorchestia longiramus]|nr:hypothetical protein FHG87_025289 [Trinorchestia longiramus]
MIKLTGAVEGEEQPPQPRPAPVQEVDAAQPNMMAPTMKDEDFNPWQPPLGVCERFYWGFTLPLVAIHYVTVPDCRRVGWQNWFLLTFTMSMVWISLYSYVMVWMITIIGGCLIVSLYVMRPHAVCDHTHAVCDPTLAVCDPTLAVCDPTLAVCDPTLAVCDPTVAVCEPTVAVCDPTLAVCDPTLAVCDPTRAV